MSGKILATLNLDNVDPTGITSYLQNSLNNQLVLKNHIQSSKFFNIVQNIKLRYGLANEAFTIKTKPLPVVRETTAIPASFDPDKNEVVVYIVKVGLSTYELRLY